MKKQNPNAKTIGGMSVATLKRENFKPISKEALGVALRTALTAKKKKK